MKSKRVNSITLREVHNRVGKVSLLKDLSGEDDVVAQGDLRTEVTDLITDSRRVTPGSAFFAISGQRANGNDFLDEAINRGAKTIVSCEDNDELPSDVTSIKTENPRLALAKFAKRHHGHPDKFLNIIGVTGTNGKTTVTTL